MSTNKRKDAAALFELLDKSTLKVPKSGGSLKIPSWWSSKTNPAPAAAPPPEDLPEMPASGQRAGGGGVMNGTAGANGAAAPPSPQHRLFDPPPANAPAGVSPSIRPPAVTPPVNPPVGAGQTAVRPVVRVAEATPRGTMIPEEAPEVSPPPRASTADSGRRVFAPQTYDPNAAARRHWMGSQKRVMARTPPWAVLTVVGAVVAFLILMVVVFVRRYQQTSAAGAGGAPAIDWRHASGSSFAQDRGSSQPLTPPSPANGGSFLPPQRPPVLQQNTPTDSGEPVAEPNQTPGKVYAPGTVDRDPKLLYIIIASTPQVDVAQRNAKFIADNGVDVSIETLKSPRGKSTMFTLISVQGFPTVTEAEAYRKRIVQIGHKTPDFQKTRKAWDDAYAQHVKSLAQTK